MTTQTLPDTQDIGFSWDDGSNMTSLTPPGKGAHTFSYTENDLASTYDPPDAGFSPDQTLTSYDDDLQLDFVDRPGNRDVDFVYEPATGRLDHIESLGEVIDYQYDSQTGQLTSLRTEVQGQTTQTLAYQWDGPLLTRSDWDATSADGGALSTHIARTYDNDFRVTSRSINGAHTVNFDFHDDGMLESAGPESLGYHQGRGSHVGDSGGNQPFAI